MNKFLIYAKLMRLNKPVGIYLLLWPMLWAFWIAAKGIPSLKMLAIFLIGTVLMRSAGCVINDISDRNFDGSVARTQHRPLPAKLLSTREATILFFSLVVLSFGLVLLTNLFTIALSFAGLALTMIYPLTKRFLNYPQLFLGFAFGWAVPMVFTAQTNHLPSIAWVIFLIAILWATSYDTIYAMVDRDDDLKIGIYSTAIWFGHADIWIIALLNILVLSIWLWLGVSLQLNFWFYLSWIIAASIAAYQQWLIKDRERQSCFRSFLLSHWLGCMIWLGLVASYA